MIVFCCLCLHTEPKSYIYTDSTCSFFGFPSMFLVWPQSRFQVSLADTKGWRKNTADHWLARENGAASHLLISALMQDFPDSPVSFSSLLSRCLQSSLKQSFPPCRDKRSHLEKSSTPSPQHLPLFLCSSRQRWCHSSFTWCRFDSRLHWRDTMCK